jgi:predicted CXXCH cytochrome family protein
MEVIPAEDNKAHPFNTGSNLVCMDCHREHFGGQPVPNTVTPTHFEERCGDCHDDDSADPKSLLAGLLAGLKEAELDYGLDESSDEPPSTWVAPRGFEAFSHGDHSEIQDCSTCHITAETDQGRDFAALSFETCDQCHRADLDSASGLALGVELPPEDKRWTVNWHGVGEDQGNCRQCHSTPDSRELNKLERSDPIALTFDLGLRTHGDQFDLDTKSEDCSICHVDGDSLPLDRMIIGRPFSHDIHLSLLDRADSDSVSAVNQQCAECHVETINSSGLAAAPVVFAGPPLSVCAKCHAESDELALITKPGEPISQVAKHSAHDFPHERHKGIEGGCVACHDMDTSLPAGAIMISTPAEKAACVRCHMDQQQGANLSHMNIGGGDCVVCHQPRAESEPGSLLSAVFYEAPSKERSDSHFPHHQAGHQDISCKDCHGDPAVQGFEEVHSPPKNAYSCRECHARNRFHWR